MSHCHCRLQSKRNPDNKPLHPTKHTAVLAVLFLVQCAILLRTVVVPCCTSLGCVSVSTCAADHQQAAETGVMIPRTVKYGPKVKCTHIIELFQALTSILPSPSLSHTNKLLTMQPCTVCGSSNSSNSSNRVPAGVAAKRAAGLMRA